MQIFLTREKKTVTSGNWLMTFWQRAGQQYFSFMIIIFVIFLILWLEVFCTVPAIEYFGQRLLGFCPLDRHTGLVVGGRERGGSS
jgi:hypothetical protein